MDKKKEQLNRRIWAVVALICIFTMVFAMFA
jgi:hypothetical protein